MYTNSLKSREIEFIELYPYRSNAELADYFKKNISTIKGFANYLGLKKHKSYLSSLRSQLTTKQHEYGKNFKFQDGMA